MKTALIEKELRAVLDDEKGERYIHKFLKEHNQLLVMAFNRAWNFYVCVPEFELGRDYRSDFLILSAHSGNWNAIFIELKSPTSRLYNKNGTKSESLRLAEKQIVDWSNWIRINEQYLRYNFARILRNENAPAIWPHEITNYTKGYSSGADEISDMMNTVSYYYHIVIGRNSTLTPDERERRAKDITWGGPEIATYDRLLTMAQRVNHANILIEK